MGDGPVLVTVGRLVLVKDHRTLFQAFAVLRADRPLPPLWETGPGSNRTPMPKISA